MFVCLSIIMASCSYSHLCKLYSFGLVSKLLLIQQIVFQALNSDLKLAQSKIELKYFQSTCIQPVCSLCVLKNFFFFFLKKTITLKYKKRKEKKKSNPNPLKNIYYVFCNNKTTD